MDDMIIMCVIYIYIYKDYQGCILYVLYKGLLDIKLYIFVK